MTKQNQLISHTFESSGKTVFLRRVSIATLMMDLIQENPKPLPPLQEVEIGGKKIAERNYAHPDYPAIIATWENEIETKVMMALIAGYIHVDLTDEDKQEVKQYREDMQGIRNLNMSDKQVFIRHIAITSDPDFTGLLTKFRNTGQPTEEGIASTADGFPGDSGKS